jgi:ABC-type bacteriocin/lantibiotic exporter with double-glycine peptidase domain
MPTPAARDVVPVGPLEGRITVERASVRLLPLSPPALREVSLEIAPGQFVAIVGASGSGKSILASLLIGMFQPSSGRVLLDGNDIAGLDFHSVQRQTGVVPQRPHLLPATIGANISLSDPSLPFDKLVEAARAARVHEEIAALPRGYDTVLTDGGHWVTESRRQRIALARALVARPAVLLLDEAAGASEARDDHHLQRALVELSCTRIVIARRPLTMEAAHRIVLVQEGRVTEQGTHRELLDGSSAYTRLVRALRPGDRSV